MAFDYHDRIARDPGVVGGQAVINGTRRICRGLCTGRSSTRRIHGPVKLKLDENLPRQLVPILTSLGHDVDTGPDEYLAGQVDHGVDRGSVGRSTPRDARSRRLPTHESTPPGRITACCSSGCRSRVDRRSCTGSRCSARTALAVGVLMAAFAAFLAHAVAVTAPLFAQP